MKLYRYILLTVAALTAWTSTVAQSRNSYFMEGSYFRNELNPALTPTRGYIALPVISGIGINLNSNYLAVNNFFFKRDGQVVTGLHSSVSADEFLGKLPEKNKLANNMNLNILGVGFFTKGNFWNFGINLRSQNDMTLSKDIFSALKTLGNGTYDLTDSRIGSTTFAEMYVGHSRDILDWGTVGAKIKLLMGLENTTTIIDQMEAVVGREQVVGRLRGIVRANGIFIDPTKAKVGEEFDSDIMGAEELLFKSFGAAIDLGAEVRLLDNRLRVSGAITDLGFIRWGAKSRVDMDATGDFYYRGIDLDTGDADSDGNAELLVTQSPDKGYTTRLNCSLNFGAEYNILDDRIGFGLLSHTEFCQTMSFTELTVSANFRPLNWLSATISHTLCNRNKFGVLGFALNLHYTGINFFVGADYLGLGMVKYEDVSIPRNMKSLNLYMGLGFGLKGKK